MIIHKHLYPYNWHNSKLTLDYSVYISLPTSVKNLFENP